MPEGERILFAAQRFKNINLNAGIGDVILTADDMGDPHLQIIND